MGQNNSTDSPNANDFMLSPGGIRSGGIHIARTGIYIHKLLPAAVLYFFLNSAGLPLGLYYTTILSPLFFLWLYREGRHWLTLKFVVCLLPFIVAHICLGIDSPFYYARSTLLLWTVYITVYAFCWALLKCRHIEILFEQLIVLNFYAAMAALVLLFTPIKEILWNTHFEFLGDTGSGTPRLQLLTLEPSVYGQLMAPLLIFAVLRLIRSPGKRNFIYAAMITIPMLLSQSFGGISICTAGLGVAMLPMFRRLLRQRHSILILALIGILLAGLLLVPNPLLLRITEVATGQDSSIHSRTDNGFLVAFFVASQKSLWWGVGLGQTKLLDVYGLNLGFDRAIIPNSIAATFAELGIVAVLIKFAAEIYLFFKTRVYANTLSLAMFVVAFLFQLTGSHLMNVQEYMIWILAFVPLFPRFDLQSVPNSPWCKS
jgi:hypothetical protein